MSHTNERRELEGARLLEFPSIPPGTIGENGQIMLNRWSNTLTHGHDFPGAQAMLYAAGVPNETAMKNHAQVGIASMWFEG